MINVIVTDDVLRVVGHAGYDEPGRDIVCAAVSTLAETLTASIDNLTTDTYHGSTLPGESTLLTKHLRDPKSRILIGAFLIGVEMIANEYPDYVRLTQESNGLGTERSGAKGEYENEH